jgi:hypothetical protein
VVQSNLAGIGVDVRVREVDDLQGALESGAKFDLLDTRTAILYPDAGSFLSQMLEDIPHAWLPLDVRTKIEALENMSGDARQTAAGRVADEFATEEVAVAAYSVPQTSQFFGPGVGCRLFTSFGYGLDLAALCMNGSAS